MTTLSQGISDRISQNRGALFSRIQNTNEIPDVIINNEDNTLLINNGDFLVKLDENATSIDIGETEVIIVPIDTTITDLREDFEIFYDDDISLLEEVRFKKKVKIAGGKTKFVLLKNKNKNKVRTSSGKDVSRSSQRERLKKLSKSLKRRFRKNRSKLIRQIKKGKKRNKNNNSDKRVA